MTADLPSDLWLLAEPESAFSLSGCLALLGLLTRRVPQPGVLCPQGWRRCRCQLPSAVTS